MPTSSPERVALVDGGSDATCSFAAAAGAWAGAEEAAAAGSGAWAMAGPHPPTDNRKSAQPTKTSVRATKPGNDAVGAEPGSCIVASLRHASQSGGSILSDRASLARRKFSSSIRFVGKEAVRGRVPSTVSRPVRLALALALVGCGSSPSPDDGASCVGTCTPKLVAQSPSAAFVVAEGPSVYWSGAEWTDGRIWTAPITGGTAVTLATGQSNPWALRVVDNSVFWVNNGAHLQAEGALMRVGLEPGATPVSLAPDQHAAQGLALAGGQAYWVASNSLMTMPLAGGSNAEVLLHSDEARDVAVDANNVYCSTYDSPGAVRAVPRAGGSPVTLLEGLVYPRRPAVDEENVYVTTGDGYVMKAPLAGGAATTLAHVGNPASYLALDGDRIYFARVGDQAAIFMVGKNGEGLAKVADADPGASHFDVAVDGSNVYFTSTRGVMRLAKP